MFALPLGSFFHICRQCHIAQAGLELSLYGGKDDLELSLSPECWSYMCVPPLYIYVAGAGDGTQGLTYVSDDFDR